MPVPFPALPPRKHLRPRGTPDLPPLRATRVLDQLRERLRFMHYSVRTEEVYVYWVKAFIRFHRLRHLYDLTFQRAFKRAVQATGIDKPATPHTLRHYVPRRTMSTH